MFQVGQLQELTAPELLALTVEDLVDGKPAASVFFRQRPSSAVKVLRLLRTYYTQVRPLFIGANRSALFLTLEG